MFPCGLHSLNGLIGLSRWKPSFLLDGRQEFPPCFKPNAGVLAIAFFWRSRCKEYLYSIFVVEFISNFCQKHWAEPFSFLCRIYREFEFLKSFSFWINKNCHDVLGILFLFFHLFFILFHLFDFETRLNRVYFFPNHNCVRILILIFFFLLLHFCVLS